MIIRTNVKSLNSHRNLKMVGNLQSRASQRLSSGFRINTAADDAAGLGISEKMRSQIRGLNQAQFNAQDGISLLNVADGALSTVADIIIRMRELTIQAANDTNVYEDRLRIQDEIAQLTSELNSISQNTEFNTRRLFDGHIGAPHEWNYGLRQVRMQRDPAIITAGNDFNAPVRIVPQTPTTSPPNTTPGPASDMIPTNLVALNGDPNSDPPRPPTFPREGIFVIQVQLPGESVRNEYIDFFTENEDGLFSKDDFRTHFEQRFADLLPYPQGTAEPGEEQLYFYVCTDGEIAVQTGGFQPGRSSVTIGATNVPLAALNPPLSPGSPQILANSAILGATDGQNPSNSAWRLSPSPHTPVSDRVELDALNELDATDSNIALNTASVWETVPPLTWSYTVFERVQNAEGVWMEVPLGNQSFSTTLGTTMSNASEVARALLSDDHWPFAPPTEASPYFSGFFSADRDGNVYTNISFSGLELHPDLEAQQEQTPMGSRFVIRSTPPPPPSTFLAVSGTTVQTTPSIESRYPARVSEREGELTIRISNVPGASVAPATVVVNFRDNPNTVRLPGPDGPVLESFSDDASDMARAIERALNNAMFHPANPPRPGLHPAGFSPDRPVATVDINPENGRLRIVSSERGFGISIEEQRSDHPMFLDQRTAVNGYTVSAESMTVTVRHGGQTLVKHVPIAVGNYRDIDEFIRLNQGGFNSQDLILGRDGNRLTITTMIEGIEVVVHPSAIGLGQPLRSQLGYSGLLPNTYQSGDTFPQPEMGLWIHTGANSGQGLHIAIPRLNAQDLGLMITSFNHANPDLYSGISTVFGTAQYTTTANVTIMGTSDMGYSLNVTSAEKANAALAILDNALTIATTERSIFGALTNRLEFTINNLGIASENLSAANMRIRDADMALEMMRLTQANILEQAATLMLAQANQSPQSVLQLLG